MDPRYLVVVTACVVLSAYAALQLSRLWRHETTALDHRLASWPGDEMSWRGFVRTLPSIFGFFWLLTLAIVVGPPVPEQPSDSFGFVRPAWYSLPVAALPFAAIATWTSIYFFKRPRFLIPPHLRGGEDRREGSA